MLNGKLEMLGLNPTNELSIKRGEKGNFEATQRFKGAEDAIRRLGLTKENFEKALSREMQLRTKPGGERDSDSRLQYTFKRTGDSLELIARHSIGFKR